MNRHDDRTRMLKLTKKMRGRIKMAYIKDLRAKVGHQPPIMTSASGALVNEKQQVLLQERADTGDWGFPGGYMEFGESFQDTVKREFKEDAGIEIEPVKLLKLSDQELYTYPNGDQVQPINAFFLVKAAGSRQTAFKPTETLRIRYFSLDEAPKFFNHQHAIMWQTIKDELESQFFLDRFR